MTDEDNRTATIDAGADDHEALLQNIFALDLKQCHLDVCLVAAKAHEDIPRFRRINLSQNVVDEFYKTIDIALEPYRKDLADGHRVIREYAADDVQPEDAIEYLNIAPYKAVVNQITPLSHYIDMSYFDHHDKDFVQTLRFYVMIIQPQQGPTVYFYRKYDDSKLITESGVFGMRMLQSHLYEKITEPTFLFDRHIDCISCGTHMYILDKHFFHLIFRFTDALKETAGKTLEELRIKNLIENFERFQRDCMKHYIKILMLKNISMSNHLQTLTIEKLESAIKHYKGRDVEIRVEYFNGKKKMLYNPQRPWDILNLLNDNFADSPLTGTSYHMRGKRGINRRR